MQYITVSQVGNVVPKLTDMISFVTFVMKCE